MSPDEIADLEHLRRARGFMDRHDAERLSVPAMAERAFMSSSHFSRKFRTTFGETPYSYLMTRRIERAMAVLPGMRRPSNNRPPIGTVPIDPVRRAVDNDWATVPVTMPTIRRAVPSAITLVGLVLAFWSLVLTDEGRFEAAAWLVFASALVDTFDGPVARALGVISGFGSQLDSLVDLVAAGVAPAFLVYQVYFESWGFIGMLVATSWVGFVAARLARFNTSPGDDPLRFVGFPCPIAATVVAQYLVFNRATFDDDGPAWVLALTIGVLGLLMLSNVPYWKAATVMPSQFLKHPYGPGVAATALSSMVFPRQALFFWVSVSFVAAVVLHAVRLLGHVVDPVVVTAPSNPPRTG